MTPRAGTGPRALPYEGLRVFEGLAAATAGEGRDPVNAAMIRHWCEAMGDTHPAYRGPDAVAPPTMLQAWTMAGLSGYAGRAGAYDDLLALLDGAGYTAVVATDCEQEYLRPLRPGDLVRFDAVIESVSPLKTTKLGAGHFVTTRMDVRVGGELAGTHRFRILKYAPGRWGAGATAPARAPGSGSARGSGSGSALVSAPAPAPASESGAAAAAPPAPKPPRPRPVVNRDNAGFWDGVAAHQLLIQRCGDCAALRFPWLPGCNRCGSQEWDTVRAGGEGTVFSYVVMHHPPFPAFDPPYAVGLIELAEGVRIVSNVVGVPADEVRIGMPVRLEFLRVDAERVDAECVDAERVDAEYELPVFRAFEGGEA
ncbi:bifunctional MaoC family dehydratase N-terminal/OB-fold nucleic acid binding domain-containing protein [Streptomyces sp. SGAir0957]